MHFTNLTSIYNIIQEIIHITGTTYSLKDSEVDTLFFNHVNYSRGRIIRKFILTQGGDIKTCMKPAI